MSDVQVFVQSVNQVLWVQEETERVRDAMNRITAYSAVEMPSDLKEVRIVLYKHVTSNSLANEMIIQGPSDGGVAKDSICLATQ